MLKFLGVINGKEVDDAMDFIIEARKGIEHVPDNALGTIMNQLTDVQLESNVFTEKEIDLLKSERKEQFKQTKEVMISLDKIELSDDGIDDENYDNKIEEIINESIRSLFR